MKINLTVCKYEKLYSQRICLFINDHANVKRLGYCLIISRVILLWDVFSLKKSFLF